MSDTPRSIELEVEVPGTPDQVWEAIATGPGISSWYVPHTVEEKAGGVATASFGEGPEMQIPGRVAVWDPPRRIVFDDGKPGTVLEGDDAVPSTGMAFEWLVEARDGGSCVVRLINTGFGDGSPWDDQYDAMHEGWKLFLLNLRLHLEHFAGRTAASALPMAMWPLDPQATWARFAAASGAPADPAVGDVVTLDPGEPAGRLQGTVVKATPNSMALLITEPAPGTAFVAAEGAGHACGVSVWAYLYGEGREQRAEAFGTSWQSWLAGNAPAQEPQA